MLNKQKLKKEIRKLNDSSYEEFSSFPNNCSDACRSWSQCYYLYAEKMIPLTSSLILARTKARISLMGICGCSDLLSAATIFENSLNSFAEEVASGIVYPFSGVKPKKQLNLEPIFIKALKGGSAEEFAENLSTEIDIWFRSGTAININSGLVINWN